MQAFPSVCTGGACYRFCYPIPWYGAERDGTASWLQARFRPEKIDQGGRDDTRRDDQNRSFKPPLL